MSHTTNKGTNSLLSILQQAVANAPQNMTDDVILDKLEALLAARRNNATTPDKLPRKGRWRKATSDQGLAAGPTQPGTSNDQQAPNGQWRVDERRFPGKNVSGATQVLAALRDGRDPEGGVVVFDKAQKAESVELATAHEIQKSMTVIVSDTAGDDQATADDANSSQCVSVVTGGRPSMKKLQCTDLRGEQSRGAEVRG